MTDPWCYIWWHGSHQYTPFLLALIYQHHGSVMANELMWKTSWDEVSQDPNRIGLLSKWVYSTDGSVGLLMANVIICCLWFNIVYNCFIRMFNWCLWVFTMVYNFIKIKQYNNSYWIQVWLDGFVIKPTYNLGGHVQRPIQAVPTNNQQTRQFQRSVLALLSLLSSNALCCLGINCTDYLGAKSRSSIQLGNTTVIST